MGGREVVEEVVVGTSVVDTTFSLELKLNGQGH